MMASGAAFPGIERGATFVLHEGSRTLSCAASLVAAPLAALEADARDVLGPDEQALLTDRLAPSRRQSFLAGRRAAKTALSVLAPGVSLREISVLPGLLQQPVAVVPGRSNLQVTLSHAGTAAIAVAHPEACPMGVDLERAAPEAQSALGEQTTPRERALAQAVLPYDEHQRLLLLWCLKEALSKALRCGLTVPFRLLEVASLVPLPGGVRARFENFTQYEGIAFCEAPFTLALVLPHSVRWQSTDAADSPQILREWLSDVAAVG
ncbi:4'-phosphopantetheinyl transferase [Rhodopseudomonas rhenobacensis]|uniref:4'-phosphopantetheinyl transferase n=1 Tax=Rhodopseudomonas rhenobacensis TaxID=87461 RepID=A0A7W7Z1I1_9BRAD|nr:4'-phosphopantetheinyl transferase superfamily protein [Rhodopseudomonas rhenobacensis]MBB5046065.1 4'-phosphopantetheinyl transferase [Rhodopseudomonas rhenobacensis]